jgi:hypothetical protein
MTSWGKKSLDKINRCNMNKKDQERFDKLMEAASDAAYEAAEAMDRADLEEWNKLQDRAESLRNKANKIGIKKTTEKARGKKTTRKPASRTGRTKR